MIELSALAKINLTLEVLGKRDDGYHDIMTVLQTINMADRISLELSDELSFVCHDAGVACVDKLRESLVGAANLIKRQTGCQLGTVIHVDKISIPRAAGLGSSSTDCAAVLKGLNRLWELGLGHEDLSLLASAIGSDTPFFIHGGTALAEGRGEKITPVDNPPRTWLVLLSPPIEPVGEKTAQMYGKLDKTHYSDGNRSRRMVEKLKSDGALYFEMLYNTFEIVAFDFFPQLSKYWQMFLDEGFDQVRLAGAGPAMFTLVNEREEGERLVERLKQKGQSACLTHTV
ncbi:MAG: 4-(cytidine 5'-diphospho)-2-C-methyl-D-erythritol kinase [Dehalococcoidia bacterium]